MFFERYLTIPAFYYRSIGMMRSFFYGDVSLLSCISVPVQTALNVGKQKVLFQYQNLKFGIYTILYTVKILYFSTNYFLYVFPDYPEHS